MKPLFVSIPHSGEKVPPEATWLQNLPEEILMCDVDRYVDYLYEPTLSALKIPWVKTEWHRYIADLNRIPTDVDCDSVTGNSNPSGSFNRGFHWVVTTLNYRLMPKPISPELHQQWVDLVYEPFHKQIRTFYKNFESQGFKNIYHLDCHSMPSVGTAQHRDPGSRRADIVVSDCHQKSADSKFKDLVISAYEKAGFKVAYNWPYFGGRVSEQYGDPDHGHHAIQVEMNRDLYMNEATKKLKPEAEDVRNKVKVALEYILQGLS